jgi:ribosomal-protein-alanine N-acetyltransferase
MELDKENAVLDEGDRAVIRHLTAGDCDEFVKLVKASAKLLAPWVYLPDSSLEFDDYLRVFDSVSAVCLLVCARETGAIAGTISITGITRGAYQSARIGYNAFAPTVGLGFMTEGLDMVLNFAFKELQLHRLEADIQPGNLASKKFIRKIGFRREGYSPAFIRINNIWTDHERWAINRDLFDARSVESGSVGSMTRKAAT